MNANILISRSRGQINGRMLIAILAAILVVLLALYLFWPKPEAVPVPAPGQPLETVEPAKSADERGDTAREIIERLEADPDGPDYAEAHARAQEFRADGQLADAQLLYFFAARGGYAPAAFDLATFNDPNHETASSGLVTKADPFQAYRWYTAARDAGHESASERLEALHAWAESASQSGDTDAERLLLQWEQAQ
jgi:TPR repeat protein